MNKLSHTLKILIDNANISANELANQIGVRQPIIHRILNSKTTNPSVNTLSPIANYFSISISQLIGDTPLPQFNNVNSLCSLALKQVPVIHWNNIAKWLKNKDQTAITNFVAIEKNISDRAFALKMHECGSNVADPRFYENSIIIIEPNIDCRNKDYVIVSASQSSFPARRQGTVSSDDLNKARNLNTKSAQNSYVIRQLLIDGNNKYLKPLNLENATKEIGTNEKIIGTVIEARHNLVELDKRAK